MKNATLEQILSEINKQTGMDYGFQSNGKVDKNQRFSLNVKGVTVEEALTTLVKDSPYDYILEKNRVVIIARQKKVVSLMSISGRVVDEKGKSDSRSHRVGARDDSRSGFGCRWTIHD